MKLSSIPVLLCGTLFGLVANVRALGYYAHFYDDDACTTNKGLGVSIHNPGCLGEAGRGSVEIPNTGMGDDAANAFCLVKTSPDGSCSCQSASYKFTATGFCLPLDPKDQSYRFVHGSCDDNNCGAY